MAFLDNSGDIILDAVLTDEGRARLAKGNGSFKIVKFALGDDEINYELYNKTHASGSAYYDLEILQSPVLEAFTNNTISMKSKLMSISRTNLLYLPVLALNEKENATQKNSTYSAFLVAVDETTQNKLGPVGLTGLIQGATLGGSTHIRVDQGLNTEEVPPGYTIDADLHESQYIIEIDNRLAKVAHPTTTQLATESFIDDDSIASYYLSEGSDPHVTNNTVLDPVGENTGINEIIKGPRGSTLKFKLGSSLDLATSTYLFEQLGSTVTISSKCYNYIDTTVRVTGVTTGYRLDIPVRLLKWKADSAC